MNSNRTVTVGVKKTNQSSNQGPLGQGWIQTFGKRGGSKSEHPVTELLKGTPVQIFNDANFRA